MNKLSLLISILIATCGYFGANWLRAIDQDLRVIYSEYTLAATGLGHMYADLIRYRTTVLRVIEADSEQDFRQIASALNVVRTRMHVALERYMQASKGTTAGDRLDVRELREIKDVQTKLTAYLAASDHTVELVNQLWRTSRPEERERLRNDAERYATTVAGMKLIDVTIALERLLTMVGTIAGEVRNDGVRQLRSMSAAVIAVSIVLIVLVLRPLRSS